MKPPTALSTQKKSLLSSAVATVINHQQISALFPLHQLMQHNYIIKTCMTTYTYLTTVVQNKRSAISTFETIVSVVTTESLTNYQDLLADLKPTKVRVRPRWVIQNPVFQSHENYALPNSISSKMSATPHTMENYFTSKPTLPMKYLGYNTHL